MWSSEALPRRAALAGLAALAGCGFTPVLAPGATPLPGGAAVDAPETPDGFVLRDRLLDRLGPAPAAPRYRLAVVTEIGDTPVAITEEQELTRFNLPGAAAFTLTEEGSGRVVLSGRVDTFTGYSATGTAVATLTAERAARERLARALADLIVSRLLVALPEAA